MKIVPDVSLQFSATLSSIIILFINPVMIGKKTPITRYESSPTKAATQLQVDSSDYINSLNAKRENYCTELDIYQSFYQKKLPQKCIKHLDFLNLYCEEERKLICVNCFYGNTVHKNHVVIPVKNSLSRIKQDNVQSASTLEGLIQFIKETEIKIHENKRVLECEGEKIMKEIDLEFTEIYKMIQNKHREVKSKAALAFEKASQENSMSHQEISWWRQEMQNMKNKLPKDSAVYNQDELETEAVQIYKHLVYKLMLTERFETDKLIYIASKEEMESKFLSEVQELKEMIKYKVQDLPEVGKTSNRSRLF